MIPARLHICYAYHACGELLYTVAESAEAARIRFRELYPFRECPETAEYVCERTRPQYFRRFEPGPEGGK